MHKLKVLQILPNLVSGGVERGTVEVVQALSVNGHIAYVCSNGGDMLPAIENVGGKHFKLPVHTKNPFKMVCNIFALYKLIKDYEIDIVHARSRAPAWSAYFASKIAKVRFVTTFHGTYGISNTFKRLYNSVMLKGDRVIAVSEFIYKHIQKNYKVDLSKVLVINRGADINYFNPDKVTPERASKVAGKIALLSSDSRIKILLPARFTRWKGHLYCLEILKHLQEWNKDFLCYFVGASAPDSNYTQEIKKQIEVLGLQDHVKMSAAIDDMPALYSLFDIVIIPSLKPEAFGRTVVEAQAMGKLVFGIHHGAIIETIKHNKTGFHIPINNAKIAAQVLRNVIEMDKQKIEAVSNAAKESAREEYNIDIMCSKTIKLYLSLVG